MAFELTKEAVHVFEKVLRAYSVSPRILLPEAFFADGGLQGLAERERAGRTQDGSNPATMPSATLPADERPAVFPGGPNAPRPTVAGPLQVDWDEANAFASSELGLQLDSPTVAYNDYDRVHGVMQASNGLTRRGANGMAPTLLAAEVYWGMVADFNTELPVEVLFAMQWRASRAGNAGRVGVDRAGWWRWPEHEALETISCTHFHYSSKRKPTTREVSDGGVCGRLPISTVLMQSEGEKSEVKVATGPVATLVPWKGRYRMPMHPDPTVTVALNSRVTNHNFMLYQMRSVSYIIAGGTPSAPAAVGNICAEILLRKPEGRKRDQTGGVVLVKGEKTRTPRVPILARVHFRYYCAERIDGRGAAVQPYWEASGLTVLAFDYMSGRSFGYDLTANNTASLATRDVSMGSSDASMVKVFSLTDLRDIAVQDVTLDNVMRTEYLDLFGTSGMQFSRGGFGKRRRVDA